MQITNHFLDRYAERILGISDLLAARQYINQNREKIEEDIRKLFEHSELLITMQLQGDKTTKNFYIRDNIILVAKSDNSVLITLYRIDFSFGEKTDRMIIQNLKEEIQTLKEQMKNKKESIDNEIEFKKKEVEMIGIEVINLEQQLNMLKLKKQTKENEIRVSYNEVEILNKQIEMRAIKLCNSLEYKSDILKAAK